jgi:hypothetical protein
MKIILFFIVFILGSLLLINFSGGDQVVTGSELDAVLAFSEPIAENMFAGYAANDYATFSRDFDPDMQETIPAGLFVGWKLNLDDKLGNYLSHQVEQVTQSDEYYVVVYQVRFEKDEQAKIGIVFHAAEPHTINHLWIESKQL